MWCEGGRDNERSGKGKERQRKDVCVCVCVCDDITIMINDNI